jgi:hypothetical protein
MVWRTKFSYDQVAVAAARFIRDFFEPRRRRRAPPLKVALVRGNEAGPVSFGRALLSQLLAEGKDYDEIAVQDRNDAEHIAERIIQAAPSIVVLLIDPGIAVPLAERVEEEWKKGPRPTYLVATNALEPFKTLIGASAERRARFFSIISTSNSAANAHFVIRFNEAHERKVSRTENPGSTYDAFFLLAYAAYARGDALITGPGLAHEFERLVPPGRAIDVGPSQVFEALTQLAAGGRIDLEGTDTTLDYDLTTGEARSDLALVCAAVDEDGNASGESVESGVVFKAKSRSVVGTMHCP